ncbi:hypothetical protein P691DRAFT_793327 [Macrolepiota fuliginosa MF-IS2]|uniref:PARP catalytic domain-containing protein n=1 Tax=Macrolepiota fuliginosa MF-IS2 TaxID=1400762 RepID=A0A9P5WZ03_9AGAR|nr:hypothetical protein P691DRAFT_793327 [Macrolepiota fuliginosa MF-IS2]
MVSFVQSVVLWNSNRTQAGASSDDLCEICGLKPKFVEKGFKHPYCSRTCARSSGQGASPTACLLPGCRATGKPAFSNFCSEDHAVAGVRQGQVAGCARCGVQPSTVGELCVACDRRARAGPKLRELNPDSSTFKNLRAQFLSEWESSVGDLPTFERAYEAILTRDVRVRHDVYRAKIGGSEEIRTFYSTLCVCDLGSKDNNLCNGQTCGICCTVKSAFISFAFGETSMGGRFGPGVYSYRNPARAHTFSTSCTTSPYQVMVACDAIVQPGQVSDEDSGANEESIFIPTADGILPAYVIMYTV